MPAPRQALEIREFPEPELAPDSALLEVALSEVCGTDVHLHHGRLEGVPYPIIPGHVSVGRLAKIRGRVSDVDGRDFAEGDKVSFLDVHQSCGACWHCLVAKATTRCPARKVYGITYGVADGLCGGWAQAVYLKPGTRLLRLDDVPFTAYMAGGCSLPTAVHASERADIALGDTVLVLGSGPVGLSCVVLARLRGAVQVLCIGAPASRLEVAAALGATATLDITAADEAARLAWVRELSDGRGADVTIEAAGAPEAVVQAMRFTRDAGRVVVVGQYTDGGEASFNPHRDLNRKHLEIRASWGSDYSHFHRAARLVADAELSRPWSRIPLTRYPLARINEALADVAEARVVKAIIEPRLL